MIIQTLLDVLYNVFSVLTTPINIPSMPAEVSDFISSALDYIGTGISILSNFVSITYLLILFAVVIAVDVGILIYKVVMWILRKIPVLGID